MLADKYFHQSGRGTKSRLDMRIGGILIALLLILVLSPGTVAAQDYAVCTYYNPNPDTYVGFPSSLFISGRRNWYNENTCTEVSGNFTVPGDGWVHLESGGSEEGATAVCEANLGSVSEVFRESSVYPSPLATLNNNVWRCVKGGTSAGKSKKSSSKAKAPKKLKPVNTEPTGIMLMKSTEIEVTAVDGLGSGIQFQRVNAAGVGNLGVISLGLLDAVDVWGEIGSGYTVCFPQIGRIIFLDAASSPRTPMNIDYIAEDGVTCATMDRAGTLALVKASEETSSARSYSAIKTLSNCAITTDYNLNFRAEPSGQKLDAMPIDTTLRTSARTRFWFKVSYNDQDGWVSAAHVTAEGSCAFSTIA